MATIAATDAQSASGSSPGIAIKENFSEVLRDNLDMVKQRVWSRNLMGTRFYKNENVSGANVRIGDFFGIGLVPVSRDATVLPQDDPGQGFQKQYDIETYRLAIHWEQSLIDDDKLGIIGKRQAKFLEAANKTIEYQLADGFNRGFGSSGAPFICADGMWLFDEDRPNPKAGVASWSNLETAAALTTGSLWTMDQAFTNNLDEVGLRAPLNMGGIIVPKALQKKAAEISRSAKNPENSMNTDNYHADLVYQMWPYLTSDTAWFGYAEGGFQSEDNEVYFFRRQSPSTKTYSTGNPDVVSQRVRMRHTLGAGRPCFWRGNAGA